MKQTRKDNGAKCPDKFVAPSGATSSHAAPRFDLLPLFGLEEVAARFGDGAIGHGEYNWCEGQDDEVYERDRFNHALEHLQRYWAKRKGRLPVHDGGDTPIQDLAAAAFGCLVLIEFERRRT